MIAEVRDTSAEVLELTEAEGAIVIKPFQSSSEKIRGSEAYYCFSTSIHCAL